MRVDHAVAHLKLHMGQRLVRKLVVKWIDLVVLKMLFG
jgi:hypothetical protein